METLTIPVISTAHLTKEVAQLLTDKGDENPHISCAAWQYGYFLYLDEPEIPEGGADIQCLIDIRDWLRRNRFSDCWVRLDCDADAVDGLPTYDW